MILLLFASLGLFSGDYDFEANVKKLEEIIQFPSRYAYLVPSWWDPDQAFQELRDNASRSQLLTLLDHPDPMVRVHANRVLFVNNREDWLDLSTSCLIDTEEINLGSCRGGNPPLFKVYFWWLEEKVDIPYGKGYMGKAPPPLSERIRGRVFAFLASQPQITPSLRKVLEEWAFPQEHESQIRELAQKGLHEALVALAKYQRESDVALIEQRLRAGREPNEGNLWAMQAAAILPSPRYDEVLQDFHWQLQGETKNTAFREWFYAALLANDSLDVPQMLLETLQNAKMHPTHRDHISTLYSVLGKTPDLDILQYEEVLFRIWEDFCYLSENHFTELWRLDPQRCRDSLALHSKLAIKPGNAFTFYYPAIEMAHYFLEIDEPQATQLMNQMIRTVIDWEVKKLLPLLLERRNAETYQAILQRLEIERDKEALEWLAMALHHLNPDAFSNNLNELLAQHPEWAHVEMNYKSKTKAERVRELMNQPPKYSDYLSEGGFAY